MSPFESASPATDGESPPASKRKSSNGTANANGRAVKRRASKACQCCRARKVRCNVVEHGAPCTNCRLDEVTCIVTESKRKKNHKFLPKAPLGSITEHSQNHNHVHHPHMRPVSGAEALASGNVNPLDINNPSFRRASASSNSVEDEEMQHGLGGIHVNHVPHSLYASQMATRGLAPSFTPLNRPQQFMNGLVNTVSLHGDLTSTRLQTPPETTPSFRALVPAYIKPLPPRMTPEDIHYLWKKGALSIPDISFRNALLRAYVEYVHPYMPLIELHDFLEIVDDDTGGRGKVSLVLFQAVMFTGTAFVDKQYLERAGYMTRKGARKAFYLKARLLYDFDYEIDRVALVQSLLLMTYWYETPDDQKDTWHWMGVAISLAHTIGLHRNPEKSNMDAKKQKLWKRIWWSCFMRDRLVALGMRRPTRIKDEDYDVPMLTLNDFEIQALSPENTIIPQDCTLIRDLQMQRDLGLLCIAKAKLSLIISHVLGAQYSVLVRDQGTAQGQEGNTRSSVMLFPKKHDQTDEVKICDAELQEWVADLPAQYAYHTPTMDELISGSSSLVVQRALLHMVYFATVSALHRPQVLPSAETSNLQQCRDLQDMSRKKVREASAAITMMSLDLHKLELERYLPTTGVTVLLPAIIIHLLDIKSQNTATREAAIDGFFKCMQVLTSLRDNYAAADYATQFLEAAIRKADIDVGAPERSATTEYSAMTGSKLQNFMASRPHTPPPDNFRNKDANGMQTLGFIAPTPNMLAHHSLASATSPPQSDSQSQNNSDTIAAAHLQNGNGNGAMLPIMNDILAGQYGEEHFEQHFNELIDYPGMDGDVSGAGLFGFEGGFGGGFGGALDSVAMVGLQGAHGESGGWAMDWEGDALWSPEEDLPGEEEDAEGDDAGGEVIGREGLMLESDIVKDEGMGKEERAIYLLQSA